MPPAGMSRCKESYSGILLTCQFARVVKGVDLRCTAGNCAWARTPQLTEIATSGSGCGDVWEELLIVWPDRVYHGRSSCCVSLKKDPGDLGEPPVLLEALPATLFQCPQVFVLLTSPLADEESNLHTCAIEPESQYGHRPPLYIWRMGPTSHEPKKKLNFACV